MAVSSASFTFFTPAVPPLAAELPPSLAAAIRQGARLGPQGFDYFFDGNDRSCALGAAVEACYPTARKTIHARYLLTPLSRLYPILQETVACPVEHCTYIDRQPLWGVIAHLNDYHRWDRRLIAAFVHAVETK